MSQTRKNIVIIGGGPTGLMAAQHLSLNTAFDVHVYEQKPSVGRKFLIAGRGGLNLTHSADFADFTGKYGPSEEFMAPYIKDFTPADLRGWALDLGSETFVGSSGHVFPKEMKSTTLMRSWTKKLTEQRVTFHLKHSFTGFDDQQNFKFADGEGVEKIVQADAALFAFGGASYAHLGSTGKWAKPFAGLGLKMEKFNAVNCGFDVNWSNLILEKFEGQPIKNIRLSHKDESSRGDLIITNYGLEGGAIYALSRSLSLAFENRPPVPIHLDLRPDMTQSEIEQKLDAPRKKQSLSSFLKKRLHCSPVEISLLREFTNKHSAQTPSAIAASIKKLTIPLTAPRPLNRAISVAGGLSKGSVDKNLMLKQHPGWFAAGEMLDWDAPTGGYLLQGCFSTGLAAAKGIEAWLQSEKP